MLKIIEFSDLSVSGAGKLSYKGDAKRADVNPIRFVGACANIIMAMSMLTDIISFDAKHSGVRREGVYTAFYSFTEKFTFAFGPLIVGIALSAAGFDKNLPPEVMQTGAIRQALLLGVCYIPGLLGIVSIFLLAGYKLKEADLK